MGWQVSLALITIEERVWVSLASFNTCFLLSPTQFLISMKVSSKKDTGLLSFCLLLCSYWDTWLWDNEVVISSPK